MSENSQIVTPEMKNQVVIVMMKLILAKGAENKMVSVYDVTNEFRKDNVDMPKVFVEATIDLLIQAKAVRYYRNERGYVYYGITKDFWAKVKEKQASKASA